MEDLKNGDCVVNKLAKEVRYTLSRIDIDKVYAMCVDKDGKEIKMPLVSLMKCPDFESPIYLD